MGVNLAHASTPCQAPRSLHQATSVRGRSLGAAEMGRSVGEQLTGPGSLHGRGWKSRVAPLMGCQYNTVTLSSTLLCSVAVGGQLESWGSRSSDQNKPKTQHPSATWSFQGSEKRQVWACWIPSKNPSLVASIASHPAHSRAPLPLPSPSSFQPKGSTQ